MRIKQKKVTKKRISTHMSLLILSLVIFVGIISFVIYSNNRTNVTNPDGFENTSSSNGDILNEAVSTYDPEGNKTNVDDSKNIMNNKPVVNNKYVAKDGDSLAILTRSYIREYMGKNNLELTKVQRMYVEGIYIYNRNYQRLNVGQSVEINENEIVTLIAKSKGMSAKTEAMWAPYARNIT